MQGSQFGSVLEFGDYVAFVKRRWRWILLGLVIGLVAGGAYLQLAPKTYTSTAKVLVYQTTTDTETANGLTNDGINLDTEAQIVRSAAVSEGAAEELGNDDPIELASNVTVTVPANTTVLEIAFEGSNPQDAQEGASAFAKAYLENRADVAQEATDADIDRLREQIDDLSRELGEVSDDLDSTDGQTRRAVLVARRSQLTSELQSLNETLGPLEGTVPRPGRTIVDAQLPEAPTAPRPLLVLVSGAMLAFLCALAAAVIKEKVDRRPHSAHDIQRAYGLPVLSEARLVDSVTGVVDAPISEARGLYHSIIAAYGGSTRSVLLCGPSDQSSANAIGTMLAALAAQAGTTTTLVQQPASYERGLSSQARDIDRRGLLTRKDYLSLGLIHAGELRHRRIPPVLAGLEDESDLCVLEPPTGDSSFDLPLLGRHVDLVLIVIDLDHTSRAEMESVIDAVQKVGATEVVAVAARRAQKRGWLRRRASRPVETESENPVRVSDEEPEAPAQQGDDESDTPAQVSDDGPEMSEEEREPKRKPRFARRGA